MSSYNKLQKLVIPYLDTDETIKESIYGAYETKIFGNDSVRNGIFVATESRLVFFSKKVVGYDLEVLPYSNISSIEMGKNLMGHYISLFATGNKITMKWINKGDIKSFVDYVRGNIGKMPDTISNNSNDENIDLLKQLAELRKQGILTEEEFSDKKKKILEL